MMFPLVDGSIELKSSACNAPPDSELLKTAMHVGSCYWLKIQGTWYRWDGTAAHKHVTEAACLTVAEFLQYHEENLLKWT